MTIIPKKIGEVISLGYTFNVPFARAVTVINKHFTGFDILMLAHDLERLLGPYALPPVAREITVTDIPPSIRLEYKSNDFLDERHGLFVSRTFSYVNEELVADHEMLILPESCRGRGIGKKVLSAYLEQYEKMQVKKIDLFAALSDGGAVWAKFGFKATKRSEMERILLVAERELISNPVLLKVVRDSFHNYYEKEPDGKAFPIQNWVEIPGMEPILRMTSSHWHGRIDLTNQQDLRNFRLYVGKKE